MTLVFSLPFCLLLPDGDYQIRMDDGETDTIHLTKIIPKVFDERLPYRGFRKGELENVSSLWINGKEVKAEDLPNSTEFGVVHKYVNKAGDEIIPQFTGDEVSISEPELINKVAKEKLSKNDMIPNDGEFDEYSMGEHYHGRQLVINTEVKKDGFGRFRYTKVYYTTPKVLPLEERFIRAISSVNRLIDVYRVETGDYWITSITEDDIFIYKNVSDTETQMAYSMKGFTRAKKDKDAETVELIKNQLKNSEPQDPFMMLILDSQKSVNEGKNYLSVIYSIIALESLIKSCIIYYTKTKGLNEKMQNDLISQGIFFLVNTMLKIFVVSSDLTEDLIKKVSDGIILRNKIIHRSKLNVSEEDARNLLFNVRTMAEVLTRDIVRQYGNGAGTV
ncbi:hypothetical protein BH18THE1_BH18THE1_22280 [soil metagenome]